MQFVRRATCAIATAIVLVGPVPYAFAQDLPTTSQLTADLQYANDILARLAYGDAADIEHSRANDFVVVTLLRTINENGAEDSRCLLTVQSPYWGYFKYSIYVLQKKLGPRESIYGHMVVHGRADEFVNNFGCSSREVQTSLNNGIRYALGEQKPVPYELVRDRVFPVGSSVIDFYCRIPGRYDPECAKLIGFIVGRPEPGCYGGLNIPAAPEPPKVVQCGYVMPISEETRRNFDRLHTYWYQRVSNNLDSLRVYGIDQFSSIAPVAVESCPKDFKEAARLSGHRKGLPISALPGEVTGIPDPPASRRVPRCEEPPVTQPTEIPQNFEEGDYDLLQEVKPVYPARALSRGMEGYVDISFTVTEIGAVKEPIITFSTSSIFDRAATRTVLKYRYKPRVVDGQPVEVTGVKARIMFVLND